MKKAIIIIGSLALLFVAGVTAFAWYILNSAEYAANRNRTAAAREKRWQKKPIEVQDVEVEEVQTNTNGEAKEEEQQQNNPT